MVACRIGWVILFSTVAPLCVLAIEPLHGQPFGTHGFADSRGVKIHYVTMGEGPLVVMIHGFPDYWYTWRKQMPPLAERFQVVAYDQRGYNQSDQPEGLRNYTVEKLVGDLAAVIEHFGQEKAIIVGHDWGGMVAWSFAMAHPNKTDRLIILNLPHPRGLLRELAKNSDQYRASQYAREFQSPEAASKLTPEMLALWVREADAREEYLQAFRRSSIEAMLNYYKANYPREPYDMSAEEFPKVQCPVLMFHGLKDRFLLPGALNDTWNWIEEDLTLITVPSAGHFIQHDAADLVIRNMLRWLPD
ncbi:MAG: alpha/beta fold hydrolase [Pirellulales bacterium]